MSNPYRILAVLCAILLLSGCELLPWTPPKADPRLSKVLYKDGDIYFFSYPLDIQFELYRYAKHYVVPYHGVLAHYIASNGSAIVPFLIEKFKTAKNAKVQEDVMFVFAVMTARKFYDAGQNTELVALLSPAIGSMKAGFVRDDAEWDLDIIMSRASDRKEPYIYSVAGRTVFPVLLHRPEISDRPQQ